MNRTVYITPGDTIHIHVRGLGEVYRVDAGWTPDEQHVDTTVWDAVNEDYIDMNTFLVEEHPGDTVVTFLDPQNSDPAWSAEAGEYAVTGDELEYLMEGLSITDLLD